MPVKFTLSGRGPIAASAGSLLCSTLDILGFDFSEALYLTDLLIFMEENALWILVWELGKSPSVLKPQN